MDTKKLRQKILDLAIRGKLVPQDPNDEPASVLLERIKAEKEQLIKEGKIKRSKKSESTDKPHYENVPFEIPESWVWTTLGNCLSLSSGTNIRVRESATKGQFPVYGGNGINGFYDSYNVTNGTIVIGRVGFYCGSIHLTDTESWVTDNALIVSHNDMCDTRFLYHLLIWHNLSKTSNSTAQPVISQKGILPLKTPIPPMSEQKRIVFAIEKYNKVIDSIEKDSVDLHHDTYTLKSKILDFAISGKLVPQDHADEPAIELLKRINPSFEPCDNSHYEKLPKSWHEIEMGEICKLCDGEKISGQSMIYIDVKYLRGTKEGEVVETGKFVTKGSTLILVDGENSGEVFTAPIDGYQGSTFKILDVSNHLNKDYVLLLIKRSQKLLRENKIGSAIPHLNKKMFRELIVPVPPLQEQKRIVKMVNDLFNILDAITAELQ